MILSLCLYDLKDLQNFVCVLSVTCFYANKIFKNSKVVGCLTNEI